MAKPFNNRAAIAINFEEVDLNLLYSLWSNILFLVCIFANIVTNRKSLVKWHSLRLKANGHLVSLGKPFSAL